MQKRISLIKLFLCLILALFLFPVSVSAQTDKINPNSYITVVNPIRGGDFWNEKNQKPIDAVLGQAEIVNSLNVNPTWLIRPDAYTDKVLIDLLKKNPAHEKGILLEITPAWTKSAGVKYRDFGNWHSAGSVFLTGYDIEERIKLIDDSFKRFKEIFGSYPKSVGAWWIDANSLEYMQTKYKINSALIVADQYTTDDYQVWGQYWGMPYYPAKKDALIPAQSEDYKIPVVMMQWAARDPFNGYGGGVQESTYSVQANDYIDFHDLDSNYFSKLVDIYTLQPNQVNQIVVGIENSYDWDKYKSEYKNQIEILARKRASSQIKIATMGEFGEWYLNKFSDVSPEHIIVANDPLGGSGKVVWYMNPYYRVGWFYNPVGSVFRDIRQYINGTEEPCLVKSCKEINFATFATRVLDDVTYGRSLIIDKGKISDFQARKIGEKYILSYKNEAGIQKEIEYLPRDIAINGKVSTIDGLILEATNQKIQKENKSDYPTSLYQKYQRSVFDLIFNLFKFVLFGIVGIFIPGYLIIKKTNFDSSIGRIFLAISLGMVMITLFAFVVGYLKMSWLIYMYILTSLGLFIKYKCIDDFKDLRLKRLLFFEFILIALILLGTFFQSVSMAKSGWVYEFGVGFWGPIGHDGIWHQALVNQLMKGVPPESPIFSGQILSNYHYFYNLLVAISSQVSTVSHMDLIYRFYPVLFSVLLGIGTIILTGLLFKSRAATVITLFLVYFGSSFGWIVEYIKENKFGGESAFWVNQPVSMNLNPPFAISIVIVIAILVTFKLYLERSSFFRLIPLVLFSGTLITFKAYAGIIVLGALLIISGIEFITTRRINLLKVFIPSLILSLIVFIPQNKDSASLLVFSPFWFIHSMIDYPDRVGWLRLSQARSAYFERGDFLKYILAEILGFAIFVLGNIGTRFLGLFTLLFLIKKKYLNNYLYLFIFLSSLISFFIPMLFIQKGNTWNTIQFFYYFLYFCALAAGIIYAKLFRYLPKIISSFFIALLILLTPISVYSTFRAGLGKFPPSTIGLFELDGLQFLKSQPEGVVLMPNYDKNLKERFSDPYPLSVYESSAYIAAFSGKSVYLADEIQHEIFQNDYKNRLVAVNDFFKNRNVEWSYQFLKENNIKYIYIPKLYAISIDSDKLNLKNIFENEDLVIYETNI